MVVYQSEYVFSPFSPPEGSLFLSARDYLPWPENPLCPIQMNDPALEPTWVIMKIDGISIGIRLLVVFFPRGLFLLSARDCLPRPGNPLWPSPMNDSEL